jgi:hypothetical protein
MQEKLILDFGPSYVLNEIMQKAAFTSLVRTVFGVPLFGPLSGPGADSVLALLAYKIINHGANCYASDWFEGDYALTSLRSRFVIQQPSCKAF